MHTDVYVNVVKCMCVDPCIHSHSKTPKRMMGKSCLVPLHQMLQSQKITDIDTKIYGPHSVFRSLLSPCHPVIS